MPTACSPYESTSRSIVGGRTPINRTQAGFWCRCRSPLTADILCECQTKVVFAGEFPARVSKGHTPSPRFLSVVNFHRVQFPNESGRTTSPVVDRIQALYRISKWHSFTPISHHRVPERLNRLACTPTGSVYKPNYPITGSCDSCRAVWQDHAEYSST